MEIIVGIFWLLIPVLRGFIAVKEIFLLVFVVNLYFINNRVVSKYIIWLSLIGSVAYSIYAAKKEFPEVPMFMVAFVAGSLLCYFLYVLALKLIRWLKAILSPNLSEEKLP
jgi:hypothetical protein